MRRRSHRQARLIPESFQDVSFRQELAAFPPLVDAQGVCAANARAALGAPPYTGVSANSPMLLIYLADPNPGTTCQYTPAKPGLWLCNGALISPYLVLTAEQCLKGNQAQSAPGCANSQVVDVVGEWCALVGQPCTCQCMLQLFTARYACILLSWEHAHVSNGVATSSMLMLLDSPWNIATTAQHTP
jgi:hypothetical protein